MDNIFSGADTLPQAAEVKNQVTKIFELSQFPLSKWAALSHLLIKNSNLEEFRFHDNEMVSALGLIWDPNSDVVPEGLAAILDPLGWISPTVIIAKILIQDLWISNVSWDDPVPSTVATT